MIYWRYLGSILGGFVLGCLLFLMAVWGQLGAPTLTSDWNYEVYQIREQVAQNTPSPKLLVISGSNAVFGISCEMIYQQTQVPCMNGGTNATLGIDYILHRAKGWLKPGDLVLMPLEFNHYDYQGIPSDSFIDHLIANDPHYLTQVNLLNQIRLIFGISWERLQQGLDARHRQRPDWRQGQLAPNFNQFGDRTNNQEANITPEFIQAIATVEPPDVNWHYIRSSQGMKSIANFIDWCRRHQIQVIATWPNTVKFSIYQQPKYQDFFQSIRDFYQRLNVTVLAEPESFMYDRSLFFDTVYHLNDRGVKIHTTQLIKLLTPYLTIKKI